MKIATVIPTYNEVKNIVVLVPSILKVFREEAIDGRVIIVDDSSPDGTGKLAEEFATNEDRVFVLKRPSKMGIGSAYKDGMKYALSTSYDNIIEIDADLSHNPAFIPSFVEKINEGYDLVIGSRYVPGGGTENWSFYRRAVSGFTNRFAKLLFGLPANDSTSGYRAYSSKALKTIDLSSVESEGYAFQVEMLMRSHRLGLKICEIPITFEGRKEGKSKLNRGEAWDFLRTIIRLKIRDST